MLSSRHSPDSGFLGNMVRMAAPLRPHYFCSFPMALLFSVAMTGLTPHCGVTLSAMLASPWQICCSGRSRLASRAAHRQGHLSQQRNWILGRKRSGAWLRKDDLPFCARSPPEHYCLQGARLAELCSCTPCHPSISCTWGLLTAIRFQAIFYLWHKSQHQRLKMGY